MNYMRPTLKMSLMKLAVIKSLEDKPIEILLYYYKCPSIRFRMRYFRWYVNEVCMYYLQDQPCKDVLVLHYDV